MSHEETFATLRDREAVTQAELDALFDALPAVERSAMLGEWGGGCFRTGHPGEAQLTALGWIGKTFRGENDVDPIVCRGKDGARVSSPVLGSAQLRSVEYRGVVTATMVYDKHPILDHFRRVDARTVLGCMDKKGDATPLYFYLQKV